MNKFKQYIMGTLALVAAYAPTSCTNLPVKYDSNNKTFGETTVTDICNDRIALEGIKADGRLDAQDRTDVTTYNTKIKDAKYASSVSEADKKFHEETMKGFSDLERLINLNRKFAIVLTGVHNKDYGNAPANKFGSEGSELYKISGQELLDKLGEEKFKKYVVDVKTVDSFNGLPVKWMPNGYAVLEGLDKLQKLPLEDAKLLVKCKKSCADKNCKDDKVDDKYFDGNRDNGELTDAFYAVENVKEPIAIKKE